MLLQVNSDSSDCSDHINTESNKILWGSFIRVKSFNSSFIWFWIYISDGIHKYQHLGLYKSYVICFPITHISDSRKFTCENNEHVMTLFSILRHIQKSYAFKYEDVHVPSPNIRYFLVPRFWNSKFSLNLFLH